MTAKFIIEKHQPAVASYLGFNSGYLSRQQKILLRAFQRAELHKQAWTSSEKSDVTTKLSLKKPDITR